MMSHLFMRLKFVVGGGIIAGVTWLAHNIYPKFGGILAVAPITTTLAFLFTRLETSQATIQDLVLASFYFAIPSIIFLIALYLLLNRVDLLTGLAGAFSIWIGAVLILNRLLMV